MRLEQITRTTRYLSFPPTRSRFIVEYSREWLFYHPEGPIGKVPVCNHFGHDSGLFVRQEHRWLIAWWLLRNWLLCRACDTLGWFRYRGFLHVPEGGDFFAYAKDWRQWHLRWWIPSHDNYWWWKRHVLPKIRARARSI